MTLQSVRKIVYAVSLLAVFVAGVAIVVANGSHQTAVNLLVVNFPAVSAGVLVLGSFAAGAVCGMLVSLLAFRVLPMHFQLRRSRKELELLRKQHDRSNNIPS